MAWDFKMHGKGKSIPVHAMKSRGSGGTVPLILNLGTVWRWVVSFTSQPLLPQENSLRYLL